MFSPSVEIDEEKTSYAKNCSSVPRGNLRSKAAPIGRHAVVAMQFDFLRPIAPIEIPVGAKRRRAFQLVIVDVELVGFEAGVVVQLAPGQRQEIAAHAEEAAKREDRVGHLPGDL